MNDALPTWHLNLTRTLADAWASDLRPAPRKPPKPRKPRKRPPRQMKPRSQTARWQRAPFAGKEKRGAVG